MPRDHEQSSSGRANSQQSSRSKSTGYVIFQQYGKEGPRIRNLYGTHTKRYNAKYKGKDGVEILARFKNPEDGTRVRFEIIQSRKAQEGRAIRGLKDRDPEKLRRHLGVHQIVWGEKGSNIRDVSSDQAPSNLIDSEAEDSSEDGDDDNISDISRKYGQPPLPNSHSHSPSSIEHDPQQSQIYILFLRPDGESEYFKEMLDMCSTDEFDADWRNKPNVNRLATFFTEAQCDQAFLNLTDSEDYHNKLATPLGLKDKKPLELRDTLTADEIDWDGYKSALRDPSRVPGPGPEEQKGYRPDWDPPLDDDGMPVDDKMSGCGH